MAKVVVLLMFSVMAPLLAEPKCDLSFKPALAGDKELSGRIMPDAARTGVRFMMTGTDAPTIASVLIDPVWGDVRIVTAAPLEAASFTIEARSPGICQASLAFTVAGVKKDTWIDWITQLPIREGTTGITFRAGKDVKSVLALVMIPRLAASEQGPIAEKSDEERKAGQRPNESTVVETHNLISYLRSEAARKLKATSGSGDKTDKVKEATTQRVYLESECVAGTLSQTMEVPVKDGRAELVFHEPIEEGQCVLAFGVGATPNDIFKNSELFNVVTPLDRSYGRVNISALAGIAVGSSGTATSQTSPYIAAIIDGVVWDNLIARKRDDIMLRPLGFGLNFFLEGRVSQAPVTNPVGSNIAGVASTLVIDQVQSQLFQAGMYAPLRVRGMGWEHDGAIQSFFVAPLMKYGAQWLKDGVETKVTTVNETPLRIVGSTQTVAVAEKRTPVVNNNAQPFYGAGFRVGFSRYRFLGNRISGRDMRRETLGYLDLTYGHQHAFRTPFLFSTTELPITNQPGRTSTTVIRGTRLEPRLMIEGRIKVPFLPLFVGVEHSRNWSKPDSAASELRFTAGLKVDVLSAVSRALGLKQKSN